MKFNVVMNASTGEIMITEPDGLVEKRTRKTMKMIRKIIKENHGFEIIIRDLSEEVSKRMSYERLLSK